ncbi:MAG: DMT family transporter, partial [Bacillota bacterium]
MTINKAHIAGVSFAIIFGFTFMFSKTALSYVSPLGLIAYRFLIAFVGFELIRRFKIVKIRFSLSHFKPLFYVAAFQPVLYFLFETYGINYTTSGEAGMMIALIPIVVSIMSAIILKEKPKPIQYGFIGLSVFGVIYIQISKAPTGIEGETIGFFLLFLAVVSAAAYNIASRSASKTLKPYEVTYFMMLSGAVIFNILYITQLSFQSRALDYIINLGHVELILPIVYLGIIASIIAFFLMNYALGQLEAHVISIYANLATVTAVIAGAVFLNEPIYRYHIIGASLIIIGVYGTV